MLAQDRRQQVYHHGLRQPIRHGGDGFVQAGVEECDDHGTADNDGCDQFCVKEYCGDTVKQSGLGEQCDDGGATPAVDKCTADCGNSGAQQSVDACFAGFYCQLGIADDVCDLDQCGRRVPKLRERIERRVDRAGIRCEDERYRSCERRLLSARRACQRASDIAARVCDDPNDDCVRTQFEVCEGILQNCAAGVVALQ